ncbi:hypothetical protein [Lysinibacillus fusiformis]|uniref:hypothetical protein n=1 Tax=Lysinibacillus fusiformis TaxID=28031 RepID=UPI003CFE3A39
MENKIILRYLDKDGGVKEIELTSMDDRGVSFGGSGDDVWEKELVSISGIPEFKAETCYKTIGSGRFKTKIPYPCMYTRLSKHSLTLKVYYPKDIEKAVIDSIVKCAEDGAITAAATVLPLFSTPASAAVAIQAGLEAFRAKFVDCIGPELVSKVSYDIEHDQHAEGDWRGV